MSIDAIIFDLGGTLIDWPDWDDDAPRRWGLAYDHLVQHTPGQFWPEKDVFAAAMREAELHHWQHVDHELVSGTAASLVRDGFERLQLPDDPQALQLTLDGYALAISNWSIIFADSVPTLLELRKQGYRLALLSNTWWASEWHNADLATHGLDALLDVVVYSSDLPYSKPHPQAFHTVTARLGIQPERCVMVGDRLSADIKGGAGVGMRTVWKKPPYNWPELDPATPDATITRIAELLPLLQQWQHEQVPASDQTS